MGFSALDGLMMGTRCGSLDPGVVLHLWRSGWTLDWVPISTIYAGEPSHVKPIAHLRHFVRATRAARRLMREGR